MAWQAQDGTTILVKACECLTCQNFFWVPSSEVAEEPKYCPFCGIGFTPEVELINDDSMSKRMAQVLEIGEKDDEL